MSTTNDKGSSEFEVDRLYDICKNGDVKGLTEAIADGKQEFLTGRHLLVAYTNKHREIIRILVNETSNINPHNIFYDACADGDSDTLQILLDIPKEKLEKWEHTKICVGMDACLRFSAGYQIAMKNGHHAIRYMLFKTGQVSGYEDSLLYNP